MSGFWQIFFRVWALHLHMLHMLHMLQGKLWRPTEACQECHEREDWVVETVISLFLDIEAALFDVVAHKS